jgi:hypothetical protein
MKFAGPFDLDACRNGVGEDVKLLDPDTSKANPRVLKA